MSGMVSRLGVPRVVAGRTIIRLWVVGTRSPGGGVAVACRFIWTGEVACKVCQGMGPLRRTFEGIESLRRFNPASERICDDCQVYCRGCGCGYNESYKALREFRRAGGGVRFDCWACVRREKREEKRRAAARAKREKTKKLRQRLVSVFGDPVYSGDKLRKLCEVCGGSFSTHYHGEYRCLRCSALANVEHYSLVPLEYNDLRSMIGDNVEEVRLYEA